MKQHSKSITTLTLLVLLLAISACGTEAPARPTITGTLRATQETTAAPPATSAPAFTPTTTHRLTPVSTLTPFSGASGRIAYTSCTATEFYGPEDFVGCEIYAANADGKDPIQLTRNEIWDCCAVWSPDGAKIAFVSFLDSGSAISVMNSDGSDSVRLTSSEYHNSSPAWSPDGTRIAFASNRNGYSEIYVMDTDGGNLTQLTDDQGSSDPAWSPDGTRIAYTRDSMTDGGIYVMSADGSNPIRLNNRIRWAASLDWSPDGTRIALSTSFGENIDVYVMDADGSNLIRLTEDPEVDDGPVWSPDGSHIAFLSGRSAAPGLDLYLMNSDGSNQTLLLPRAGSVAWLNKTQESIIPRSDCTSGWTRLQVEKDARVTQDTITPNRVRSGPSTADKVIALLHPGSILKVLEGPICADGLIFWKVENELIPGGAGWTAEGNGKEYWLEPYTP